MAARAGCPPQQARPGRRPVPRTRVKAREQSGKASAATSPRVWALGVVSRRRRGRTAARHSVREKPLASAGGAREEGGATGSQRRARAMADWQRRRRRSVAMERTRQRRGRAARVRAGRRDAVRGRRRRLDEGESACRFGPSGGGCWGLLWCRAVGQCTMTVLPLHNKNSYFMEAMRGDGKQFRIRKRTHKIIEQNKQIIRTIMPTDGGKKS